MSQAVEPQQIRQAFPLFSPSEQTGSSDSRWKIFFELRNFILADDGPGHKEESYVALLKFFGLHYLGNFAPFPLLSVQEFLCRFKIALRSVRDELNNRSAFLLPANLRDAFGSEGRVGLIDDPLELLKISALEPRNECEAIRKLRARFDFLLGLLVTACTMYMEQENFEQVARFLEEKFFAPQDRFSRLLVVFAKDTLAFKSTLVHAGQDIHFDAEFWAQELQTVPSQVERIFLYCRQYYFGKNNTGIVAVNWDKKQVVATAFKILLKRLVDDQFRPDVAKIRDLFRVRFTIPEPNDKDGFITLLCTACPGLQIVSRRENGFSSSLWGATKLVGSVVGVQIETQVFSLAEYLHSSFAPGEVNYREYKKRQTECLLELLYPAEVYPHINLT